MSSTRGNLHLKLGAVKCLFSSRLPVSSTAALQFTNRHFKLIRTFQQRRFLALCSNTRASVFHTRTPSPFQLNPSYSSHQRTLTSPVKNTATHTYSTDSEQANSQSGVGSVSSVVGDFELVYTAPLKGAIRAVKLFSLTTAAAALVGGPVLVCMGNPSVPLSGRVIMSTLVMLVGISTTALLHWLIKGYVIRMHYNRNTNMIRLHTLSVIGRKKYHEFELSEAKPPSATAFSSFQARDKSYFIHAEVFKDEKLASSLLGVYADIERTQM